MSTLTSRIDRLTRERDRYRTELEFQLATFKNDECICSPYWDDDDEELGAEPHDEAQEHADFCPVYVAWRIRRALNFAEGEEDSHA